MVVFPLRIQGQVRRTKLLEEPRLEAWRQTAKLRVLQGARLLRWQLQPDRYPKPQSDNTPLTCLIHEQNVEVSRDDGDAHPRLEEGKRTNVALAAPAFDGLIVSPDRPLSFWRTLGRVTEAEGYRHGMELRGGCVVPSIGGGLCLLSNALFAMAARLGWRIIERHGHTVEAIPPKPGELWGLDATVFWPHVDLVVAPTEEFVRLEVRVEGGVLCIRAFGSKPLSQRVTLRSEGARFVGSFKENRIVRRIEDMAGYMREETIAVNRKRLVPEIERKKNCLTCGETSCRNRVVLQ